MFQVWTNDEHWVVAETADGARAVIAATQQCECDSSAEDWKPLDATRLLRVNLDDDDGIAPFERDYRDERGQRFVRAEAQEWVRHALAGRWPLLVADRNY